MEIISYVIQGALAHKDSMGNGAVIVPGEVQRMSAGRGVTHSEFNHDRDGVTHFLQIWILPKDTGIAPSYQQKAYPEAEKRGRLRRVASPDGADGSVSLHQDARLFAGLFDADEAARLALASGRLGYVHLVKGSATVNGRQATAGDALLYADEPEILIERGADAE